MKHWCFYDRATGLFNGNRFGSSDHEMLEANTPEGFAPIEGHYDHMSQRVNIETGKVVDYQPPQPSDGHEWNADMKRWQDKPEIAQKRQEKATALAQLQLLDARHLRALDEVVASPDNMVARDNLDSIRKLKEQLRSKLV